LSFAIAILLGCRGLADVDEAAVADLKLSVGV
jgi:hypothetical protein